MRGKHSLSLWIPGRLCMARCHPFHTGGRRPSQCYQRLMRALIRPVSLRAGTEVVPPERSMRIESASLLVCDRSKYFYKIFLEIKTPIKNVQQNLPTQPLHSYSVTEEGRRERAPPQFSHMLCSVKPGTGLRYLHFSVKKI